MWKIFALSFLATFSVSVYVGEETVYVHTDRLTFPRVHKFDPVIPPLEINSPCLRGLMSFRDLTWTLNGADTYEMIGRYDPIGQFLYTDLINHNYELVGNYTTSLHFFTNDTYVGGEGKLTFKANAYEIRNIKFPIHYDTQLKKFQMAYPVEQEPRAVDLDVELTGLTDLKTGAPVKMRDLFMLCLGLEKPGFVEIFRAITNYNMKTGHAKRLGEDFLHSFFGFVDAF